MGDILYVPDCGVALAEFVADLQQAGLAANLVADELVDVVEALDAFQFDACAVGDRDVDVLTDRPEAALDRSRRAEQHPDTLGGVAGLLGGRDIRFRPDFDERDA